MTYKSTKFGSYAPVNHLMVNPTEYSNVILGHVIRENGWIKFFNHIILKWLQSSFAFYHPKFSSYQQMYTQQFCTNFRLATFCHCDPSLGQQLIANLDLGSFSYGSDNTICILVGEVIVA